MVRVALVGSGKIGKMICDLLIGRGDYELTLIDALQTQLDKVSDSALGKVIYHNLDSSGRNR